MGRHPSIKVLTREDVKGAPPAGGINKVPAQGIPKGCYAVVVLPSPGRSAGRNPGAIENGAFSCFLRAGCLLNLFVCGPPFLAEGNNAKQRGKRRKTNRKSEENQRQRTNNIPKLHTHIHPPLLAKRDLLTQILAVPALN